MIIFHIGKFPIFLMRWMSWNLNWDFVGCTLDFNTTLNILFGFKFSTRIFNSICTLLFICLFVFLISTILCFNKAYFWYLSLLACHLTCPVWLIRSTTSNWSRTSLYIYIYIYKSTNVRWDGIYHLYVILFKYQSLNVILNIIIILF